MFATNEAERWWNLRRRNAELKRLLIDQKIARQQRDDTLADPFAEEIQKANAIAALRSIDDAIQQILRRQPD
jgi:hypothetical protein